MGVVIFEREALYKEVCNSPITALAGKYGLSDNGLRKICVALDIPLPGRGHWQKLAAGKPSRVPPLRPAKGRTKYRCELSDEPDAPKVSTGDWLTVSIAFEKDPENKIVVPGSLQSPSRLVELAKKYVDDYVAELEQTRQMPATPPLSKRSGATLAKFSLRRQRYASKGVLELGGEFLPMRISTGQVSRGLRIWDAVIKAAVARDFAVEAKAGRLLLNAYGHEVGLRISERVEHIVEPTKGLSNWDIALRAHIKPAPTGNLRIYVGEKQFTDSPGRPLEEQLNAVFISIFRSLESKRILKAQQEADIQRREVARQAAVERAAELEASRARKAEEKALEDALEAEAAAWQRSATIRAYVGQIVDGTPPPIAASRAPVGAVGDRDRGST